MEKTKSELSERIKQIFKYAIACGLVTNKSEFAALLEIQPATLSRYMSGAKEPSPTTLRKFNKIFNNAFSEEWLLLGTGTMLADKSVVEQHAEAAAAPVYQNNGNGGNHVTQNNVNDELLTIIHKRDEQIDRLLTIIENMKPVSTTM